MKYATSERMARIRELDARLAFSEKNIDRLFKLNYEAKSIQDLQYVIYELLCILHHKFVGAGKV